MPNKIRTKAATKPSPASWSIEKTDDTVHRMTIDMGVGGTSRYLYLLADLHWDHSKTKQQALAATLKEAKDLGAPVMLVGDTFCAMQGKFDKRSSADAIRPEHATSDYYDKICRDAGAWFKPYASSIAMVSYGNHETEILKKHQTDLVQKFHHELRDHKSPAVVGGYQGFIVLRFRWLERLAVCRTLCYHHGYGGGGEVTRGLIDHSRTRGQYNADIFVSGHIHRLNSEFNVITSATQNGKLEQRKQMFLRCSTFKDDSQDPWHIGGGRAARPIGGWRIEFQTIRPNELRDVKMIPTPTE